MTSADFRAHVQKALESLPTTVTNKALPVPERKLEALIHLNTGLYPHLKKNTRMRLDILQMKDGPEKLQYGILWSIAVSQISVPGMRAIIKSMDDYLGKAIG